MERVSLDDLIPLEDHTDYNQEAQPAPYALDEEVRNNQNGLEPWIEAYKKLMHTSIKNFHVLLLSRSWVALPQNFVDNNTPVQLFECDRNSSHGFYTLKAHAVLSVRPERLMYIIRDHNEDTRLKWDKEHTEACKELESFTTTEGEIKFVMSRVKTNIPLLSSRYNLGVSWYGYDRKTQIYKYVFRSTQHRHYKCPTDAVNTISLCGVIIRTLENKQCELFIVVHVNPGNSFPSTLANGICKEWLRERVWLYERVARDWDKYYAPPKK
jgi:hypothetical protein